jgi:uncharacterized protein (TIGR00369 family)
MSRNQLEQVLRTVPFVAALGIAVEEARPGQVVLRLPSLGSNVNHDGALHSGAMFSVGELAAGVALGTHPRLVAFKRLQKATRIDYLLPCSADVTAHAMVTGEMVQAIHAGVERDGKFQIEVPVQLMDGHGKDVAALVGVFTFRK